MNLHPTSQALRAAAIAPCFLPSVEHVFAGAPVVLPPLPADDKQNGTGDSAGRASIRKAPGGHDARQGRDGG